MNKTDAEIEKALECCVKAENIGDCMTLECPLMGDYGCEISGEEEKLFSLALDYINRLKAEEVVVVSTRCKEEKGVEAIKRWLSMWFIDVDAVMAEKPPAIVYIDDRAICFDGDTKSLLDKINNFSPWYAQ